MLRRFDDMVFFHSGLMFNSLESCFFRLTDPETQTLLSFCDDHKQCLASCRKECASNFTNSRALLDGFARNDVNYRKGDFGIESASDAQRDGHQNEIINVVRNSLVDVHASVRSTAVKAIYALPEHLGARAIYLTIPILLEPFHQPGASSDTALQALREVITSVRASTAFPVLIPTSIAHLWPRSKPEVWHL
ncbi:hypothetical protein EDD22DRAFT_958508 [Suillus occidentalis]|nr:hypothetical protein EDD22DRAFT_958508 [Suillus occidentalis]